jgi:toxin ParE1/3/4
MAKYILSKKAIEDLSTIWNYTFEVWSESQAERYYFMLTDCCQGIADNVISGRKYSEISDDLHGTKVGQHIIFYRKFVKNRIEVIRILHNRMDMKLHLDE